MLSTGTAVWKELHASYLNSYPNNDISVTTCTYVHMHVRTYMYTRQIYVCTYSMCIIKLVITSCEFFSLLHILKRSTVLTLTCWGCTAPCPIILARSSVLPVQLEVLVTLICSSVSNHGSSRHIHCSMVNISRMSTVTITAHVNFAVILRWCDVYSPIEDFHLNLNVV